MAAVLIAAVLIAAAMGGLEAMPRAQAQGEYDVPCHIEQGGAKAVGGPGCEYEFQPGSQVDFQSGIYNGNGATIVISESLVVTGSLEVATWDNTTLQTALAITNDTEIVPTGTFQPIYVATGTAGVGTGSITTTGMTVGNRLVLINVGTPPIGITDTGVFSLSGNIAMTRDDTLELMYIGGGWVEITHSTN